MLRRKLWHYLNEMPIRVSALRALGACANVLALESFMDELALVDGADPVEFRLRHLEDPTGVPAVLQRLQHLVFRLNCGFPRDTSRRPLPGPLVRLAIV